MDARQLTVTEDEDASARLELAVALKQEGNLALLTFQRESAKLSATSSGSNCRGGNDHYDDEVGAVVQCGLEAFHHYENALRIVASLYRDVAAEATRKVEEQNNPAPTRANTQSEEVLLCMGIVTSNLLQSLLTLLSAAATAPSVAKLLQHKSRPGLIEETLRRALRVHAICEPLCLKKDETVTEGAASPSPQLPAIVGKIVLRLARLFGHVAAGSVSCFAGPNNSDGELSSNKKVLLVKEITDPSLSATTASFDKAMALYRKLLPACNPSLSNVLLPRSSDERAAAILQVTREMDQLQATRDKGEARLFSGLRGSL